ncbi:autophagy-related protein 2 [Paramarasmius palmivorus]|uniref:Autophagy-related protein 2 n=1 Tax=Paramarasmius palmivorus TaxID=297713 RepID=A0AAW0DPD7_9AGAR
MSNWSWFTWLSTVPSTIASRWLDVPWNIQRRFIGYAFKRLVLDFILTGVSDEKNLDRQIDVKLDQQGASISKASVQLPSENGRQLTSLLSISHAEFEFRVLARDELSFDMQRNWKELIRTYAASFVNEAISPEKDVSKRPRPLDAEGPLVTIFVALVDRVFHAVNFDASDTKFTLVHPGNFTLIASVASITGRTGSSVEHRKITISGVTIRICDTPEPSTATTSYQRSSRAAESLFSLGKDAVALEIFESLDTTSPNRLRISINAGLIGGAFFSWQLSGLLKIPSSLDLEVALDLRGAVLLILPSGEEDDDTDIHTSIDSFLEDLSVPPTLPSGYLRIFLEDIQMHLAPNTRFHIYHARFPAQLPSAISPC